MNAIRNANGLKFDDFYFVPKPEHLVYTHWPEEPQWQLLVLPLTPAELEALAVVRSAFFKYGLDLLTDMARLTVSGYCVCICDNSDCLWPFQISFTES